MRARTEDYLKYIYLLEQKNGFVRGVDLANQMNISKATVSVQLKRMLQDGFILMDQEHQITLTARGNAIAVSVAERNATFRRLLENLGIDKEVAAKDACRMEHAVSPETFAALKKLNSETRF